MQKSNNVIRNFNNFSSKPPNPQQQQQFNKPSTTSTVNKHIIINEVEEDEDFDISDTELIRASQQVESQLKFTNVIHPTTSNALNIFSQFTNNQTQMVSDTQPLQSQMFKAPVGTHHYSTTSSSHSALDELKTEVAHYKTETMQKDGEVKILRDKLRRQEQEMQRLRTERQELTKRMQLEQDEARRAMQKKIEFKDMESQFKAQEMLDLQMKCKMLEATARKQQQSVALPPPAAVPAPSHVSAVPAPPPPPPPKQIVQKSQALKRSNILEDDNGENESPMQEPKRPHKTATDPPFVRNKSEDGIALLENRTPLSAMTMNCVQQKKKITIGKKLLPLSLLQQQTAASKQIEYKREARLCIKSKVEQKKPLMTTTTINPELEFFSQLNSYLQKINFFFSSRSKTRKESNKKLKSVHKHLLSVENDLKCICLMNSGDREDTVVVVDNLNKMSTDQLERLQTSSGCVMDSLINLLRFYLNSITLFKVNLNSKDEENVENEETENNEKEEEKKDEESSFSPDVLINSLCLAFEMLFHLFVYRVSLIDLELEQHKQKCLLIQLNNNNNNVISSSNSNNSTVKQKCKLSLFRAMAHSKLEKQRKFFFGILSSMLKSIDFTVFQQQQQPTTEKTNVKSSTIPLLSSKSTAIFSFLALKILSSTLYCLNYLIYLPVMKQIQHQKRTMKEEKKKNRNLDSAFNVSFTVQFYFGIVASLHNAFKRCPLPRFKKNLEETETEEDDEEQIEGCNQDEEENGCILQLFYDKVIKYFGEIVYLISAANENSALNATEQYNRLKKKVSDEKPHNHNQHQKQKQQQQHQSHQQSQQQNGSEINASQNNFITKIAVDDDFKSKTKKNNDDDLLIVSSGDDDDKSDQDESIIDLSKTMTTQNSDIIEIMPSMSDNEDSANKQLQLQLQKKRNSNQKLNFFNCLESSGSDLAFFFFNNFSRNIEHLELRLFSQFLNHLHSMQLLSEFAFRMNWHFSKNNNNKTRTNSSSSLFCQFSCFKEMLRSFVVLVDYQINEKYIIYGAPFRFQSILQSAFRVNSILFFNHHINHCSQNQNKKKTSNEQHQYHQHLLLLSNYFNEKTNSYPLYLQVMQCFYTLISLFQNKKSVEMISNNLLSIDNEECLNNRQRQQTEFFYFLRKDYKLTNFFCLYNLADLESDQFIANEEEEIIDDDKKIIIKKKKKRSIIGSHLYDSLVSMKSLCRSFADEQFLDLKLE